MLLAREFVDYLSRQMVERLTPQVFETTNPVGAAELISNIIEDELMIEDNLNDEVRDLLDQYSEYMRKEGVSYQEMFRRIKNQLLSQRKIIRAAGNAGDGMKLSRDKISDMSHKLIAAFKKSRDFRIKRDPNDIRLELVRTISDILVVEEKVEKAARAKIKTQKKDIPEGSEEWELLHKRYYDEELKRYGIQLGNK